MMPYIVRADVRNDEVILRDKSAWSGLRALTHRIGDCSKWPEFLNASVELYWPGEGYKVVGFKGGVRWSVANAKRHEYMVDFSKLSPELEPLLVGAWVEFP